jgi:hypothetical protein
MHSSLIKSLDFKKESIDKDGTSKSLILKDLLFLMCKAEKNKY